MIVSVYLFSAFTLENISHWFAPLLRHLPPYRDRAGESGANAGGNGRSRGRKPGGKRVQSRQARKRGCSRGGRSRSLRTQPLAQEPAGPQPSWRRTGRKKKSDAQAELDLPTTATIDELPWETAAAPLAADAEIPICVLEEQPPAPPVGGVIPPFSAPEPPASGTASPAADHLSTAVDRFPERASGALGLRRAGTEEHRRRHQSQVRRVQRDGFGGADQPRSGGHHLRIQARSGHQILAASSPFAKTSVWVCRPNRS